MDLTDENLNPTDSKTTALINQGFLSEKLFPDTLTINTDPITDYYTIEPRPFARGKFATVKRCRHKTSGQDFAAKCIRKRRRAADVRHEILHEACVLKLTNNTNKRIVRLHEIFETQSEVILVLEMLSGGELQRLIDDEESISESDVARLMRQVLEALDFLHDRKIAHLDIKPQNILLTSSFPQCDVKLCDFGISRLIAKGIEIREIVGTPDYVAPEVLHYEPISLSTDLWSVGILAYVLLSGHTPFGGDTKQETFCNITNGHLDFPNELFGNISNHAKDFIRRLLVREPSGRMTVKESLKHVWISQPNPGTTAVSAALTIESPSSVPLIISPTNNEQNESQLEKSQKEKMEHCNKMSLPEDEELTTEPVVQESLTENGRLENNNCEIEDEEDSNDDDEEEEDEEEDGEEKENQSFRLRDESIERQSRIPIEEPSQEIAIIPLEAVLEDVSSNNNRDLIEPEPIRLVRCNSEECRNDGALNVAINPLPDLGHCKESSPVAVVVPGNVLKEQQLHHNHLHYHHISSSTTVQVDRQSMKTKSEMVEFEGLTLSKRLIFSDEILVDERLGMVY